MNIGLQTYCLKAYLGLDDSFDVHGHLDSTLHFDEQYHNFKILIGWSEHNYKYF
jgi:2-iminoacetate synthase ThiH